MSQALVMGAGMLYWPTRLDQSLMNASQGRPLVARVESVQGEQMASLVVTDESGEKHRRPYVSVIGDSSMRRDGCAEHAATEPKHCDGCQIRPGKP